MGKKVRDRNIKFNKNDIIITKENGELYFEIGNKITTDTAEAVAIIMYLKSYNKEVWDIEVINKDINPLKCLYWLSGGEREWINLENYNTTWTNCFSEFMEEYGNTVIDIVKNSKTFGDIRDGFRRNINLLTVYEFSLSRNLIH